MPDYPFTTDGCSGGMTVLWRWLRRRDPPWNALCVDHDRAYWAGGTADMRAAADRTLMAGVVNNGHPAWAFAMWLAVRLGGHPLLPTSWRWGYGYKWPRGYRHGPG
ncbi:hypothetical protein [Reyranella sp.]|uniref:hypothetical protein n=1 Tax=Reyranella sp. TaxID=1929291 RepID=UPI0027317452|nr:hypothetical protein [Reyranella sp.]MDP2377806.1 hypothetical protein [Reyranella sp.]